MGLQTTLQHFDTLNQFVEPHHPNTHHATAPATNTSATNISTPIDTRSARYSNRPIVGLCAPHYGHARADPDTSAPQSRHVFTSAFLEDVQALKVVPV